MLLFAIMHGLSKYILMFVGHSSSTIINPSQESFSDAKRQKEKTVVSWSEPTQRKS